jgi:hypothetical protein
LKITDMQAACGLAQMDKLEGFIQARKDNFKFLYERLQSCQDFLILPEATPNSDPSWFGFLMTIKPDPSVVDSPAEAGPPRSGHTSIMVSTVVPKPGLQHGGRWGDRVFGSVALAAGATIIGAIALMALFLVIQAVPSLQVNQANFITSSEFNARHQPRRCRDGQSQD